MNSVMKVAAIAVAVVVALALLPLLTGRSDGVEIIHYGPDDEQFIGLVYVDGDRLAIYVHGGAFVTGCAFGRHWPTIRDFFLERGYNVATVEYRKCTECPFDDVISDIHEGVMTAVEEVNSRRPQVQVVYVGFSAGATAGGILLLGNCSFSIDEDIKYYVWLSGVYNFNQPNVRNASSRCQNILNYTVYTKNVSGDVHVFMAEGTNDSFDQYPLTNQSHLEYMKAILESRGAEVWAFWMEGPHPVTINVFTDLEYIELLEEFLSITVPEIMMR